eukprot:3644142-Rhodomonas_salina.4
MAETPTQTSGAFEGNSNGALWPLVQSSLARLACYRIEAYSSISSNRDYATTQYDFVLEYVTTDFRLFQPYSSAASGFVIQNL